MDPKLAEIVDRVAGRIVTGIVIAGALVGLAIYARPGPQRYQVIASGNAVIRLNTDSGAMIACTTERCVTLHRPGHRIDTRRIEIPRRTEPSPRPAPSGQ